MALNAQEQETLEMMELLLKRGYDIEVVESRLKLMVGDAELVNRVMAERKAIADRRVLMAKQEAVFDPENPPTPWYTGPTEHDKFWPSLKKLLSEDAGWASAVPSLDATSTDVVTLIEDPNKETISTRGLVIGYVQSGKTANFTATIAKAADAGYRLFIVLSGVHNTLRRQTQLRLNEQLCALNPTEWVPLTDDARDFGNPVLALPLVAGSQLKLLAVVKKNVTRLTNLRDWLLTAHKEGGLDNCPVLIIDDEADQASPNSAKNAELDQTTINGLIVELLALPRVAYVGYTATPFANVLANPADTKNIYPRHFIYSLPKPKGYFGSEELFGANLSEEESTLETQPHDMIRYVSEDDAAAHAVKAKQVHEPVVSDSLAEAIRWFVMATAARRVRSGQAKHSSMLIHTTMRVQPQNDFVPVLKEHIKKLKSDWNSSETENWRAQWEAEVSAEPAVRHGLTTVDFSDIEPKIENILDSTQVVADNSFSEERLLYTSDPATVIAVGGNTLSRGLTLEGLISSFFLRSASTYESALQMGRWFGYRPGYEDLPRIWTTRELAEAFRFLAQIEIAIRREVDRYKGGDAGPSDLAVRIQLHPRMRVTSKLKMQFAVQATASFSGERPQTTYFNHLDLTKSRQNIQATKILLTEAMSNGLLEKQTPAVVVFKGLHVSVVSEFLRAYSFNANSEMSSGLLSRYVEEQNKFGSLLTWNVAISTKERADGADQAIELAPGLSVNLIQRSRLIDGADPATANIGTLTSRLDRMLDIDVPDAASMSDKELQALRNQEGVPLLILYPISKDSKPRANAVLREPLQAVEHQIGVAFSFPDAAAGSEPADTIQVDLSKLALDSEEVDDELYVDSEGSHDEVTLDGR